MVLFRSRFVLLSAMSALLAACLFLPGLGGGFIFDDRPNIQGNVALHLTELNVDSLLVAAYSFQPGNGSRALSMLSFALDHWRGGGLDPRVFKITNLVIHALTVFALALFLRQLLLLANWSASRAAWAGLLLAGLWAIHPLQVSSVLYVVQRMQTLGTLFLVLAMWAYLLARYAQIEGRRSRMYLGLSGLFWALAFAAKEDAVLLPTYLLVLELTVLRFRAHRPAQENGLRRAWLLMFVVGLLVYLLVVVPHYWHWGAYPGRDFSSYERLLTQARVLVIYIGQILLPLPERLPFFYDDLEISRGLLTPTTTLPAVMLITALLALAWCWRTRRPVFACGVLLFFAGHFMTSNVLNLEMVFEHRNHLPMVGAVLAVGDVFAAAVKHWRMRPAWVAVPTALVFAAVGSATQARAHAWGEPLRFAQYSVDIAPRSERAWLALGGVYADFSGWRPNSPYLEKAIEACRDGAQRVDSALLLSNVVIYKTIKGNVTPDDWKGFHTRLKYVPMTIQNRNVVWTAIRNAQRGIPMDERGVLDTMEIVSARASFTGEENLRLASYVFSNTQYPEEALPYLKRAVKQAAADDPLIVDMLSQLASAGREGWVQQLTQINGAGE